MYESYTRQSLPSKQYRELLGTALCVSLIPIIPLALLKFLVDSHTNSNLWDVLM